MNSSEAPYNYAQYDRIFAEGQAEPFLKRVESTCRQLEELAANGTGADRDRARAALAAYRRSLALLKEIGETRSQLATSATPGR